MSGDAYEAGLTYRHKKISYFNKISIFLLYDENISIQVVF